MFISSIILFFILIFITFRVYLLDKKGILQLGIFFVHLMHGSS